METTTRAAFFQEVMAYRPMLRRGLERIVGEGEAGEVFQRLVQMEAVGGYMGDPEILHKLGAFLTGEQRRDFLPGEGKGALPERGCLGFLPHKGVPSGAGYDLCRGPVPMG